MTLKAIGKVNLAKPLQFTIVGTGAGGVAKVTGQLLAGSGGQAGTNYVATVTTKKIKPVAAVASRTLVARTTAKVAEPSSKKAPQAKPKVTVSHRPAESQLRVRTSGAARPGGPMALARSSGAPLVLGVIPSGKSRGLAG